MMNHEKMVLQKWSLQAVHLKISILQIVRLKVQEQISVR